MAQPDLKYLRAYPITHKLKGSKDRERWHWQLDTDAGFHYGGDDSGDGRKDGWPTPAAAKRAGLATMRKHFRRQLGKDGDRG